MADLSNYAETLLLTWLLTTSSATRPTAWFASLHTDDPGETGANELSTGTDADYLRQSITFTDPVTDSGEILSNLQASWTAAAGASNYTIKYVCIWDAATVGNVLVKAELVIPEDMTATDTFAVASTKYKVTMA